MNSYIIDLEHNIKNLYGQEEFSDCRIEIIETDNIAATLKGSRFLRKRRSSNLREPENETLLYSIPVHCNILCMRWEYFKLLLQNTSQEDKKIVQMKVNKDESLYLKLFIKSIYNKDIFIMMNIRMFLRVMEMADRYCCEKVMRDAAFVIPALFIRNVSDCDYVYQRVTSMNYCLAAMADITNALMKRCGKYLSSIFYPLEQNIKKYEKKFLSLSFDSFLGLLKCQKPLCYGENGVLYFTILWLENNPCVQTSENIKLMLEEINPHKISVNFLVDIVTETHPILRKFDGFTDWFIKVIANSSLTQTRKFEINILGHDRNSTIKEQALTFQLPFRKISETQYQSLETFVYKGYILRPMLNFENVELSSMRNTVYKKLVMECLNYKGNFKYIENKSAVRLCSFKVAFTIKYGDQPQAYIFPNFQGVDQTKLSRCLCDVTLCDDGQSCHETFFGFKDKNPLEGVDKFVLYLAVTDEKKWPSYFPKFMQ